ncbi:MAG: hypothetical protein SVU32_09790, partial [Candidatus Nanohaloarchaea archaeon]|nr:hypothetical protein [Candidatus Nanohaloarchaea archaeon]
MGRKGVSPLLSYVMYVAIGISAVTLAYTAGQPIVEQMQETAAIQQKMDTLSRVDSSIQSVAEHARGTQTTFTVSIRQGQLVTGNESLTYRIQSGSGIISAGSMRQIGSNLVLSANAQATVVDTYQGTPCIKMSNEYVELCVKQLGSFTDTSLQNLVLYIENTRTEVRIEPDLQAAIDTDTSYTSGAIRTRALNYGKHLGTGRV